MSDQLNNYIINGINTYGSNDLKVQVANTGLSLTTTLLGVPNNFEMNGYGFLYNGQGASWNDVRQKVQDLKAVVAPPNITTLQVNNQINITDGTNTSTITPTTMTSTTFNGALNGNASSSTTTTNVYNSALTTNNDFPVAYLQNNTIGNTKISTDTVGNHFHYNPSTNTLHLANASSKLIVSGSATAITAPNATTINFSSANVNAVSFTGALIGNASTSTTATSANVANNVNIIQEGTNATFYPTFVSNTNSQPVAIDAQLSYNPSTNTLTVPNIIGNATTATTSTNSYNLFSLNPITLNYSYPVVNTTQIGWFHKTASAFNLTIDASNKMYGMNTVAMSPGIYALKFFVYVQNGQLAPGGNVLCVLGTSNSYIGNGGSGFIDPNGTAFGFYVTRVPSFSYGCDTVVNLTWTINNTNSLNSVYYPYIGIITGTTNTVFGSYIDSTFTRIG